MAQTAPPPPGEGIPRPLPRGGRPSRSRDTRPRFQSLDAIWMFLQAAVFVGIGLIHHADPGALAAATGVIFVTYLIGWRSSGRSTGVISGLLLAACAPFTLLASHSLQTDLFALLSLGALFAFVAGSSLAALALAALAVWLRADGIALGLMLMAFTLIQHRRRALFGALIFFVPTVAALVVPHSYGGQPFAAVTFGFQPALLICLAAPAMLFAAWFLLPFFGEMADPVRRARWLPTVIWTVLSLALDTALTFGHTDRFTAVVVPFLPLWFLIAGAGLARLLPVMTGDLPIPWLRYTVATLAVLALVAIRARIEWMPIRSHTALPAQAVVLPPAPRTPAPAAISEPTRPIPVRRTLPKKPAKPKTLQAAKIPSTKAKITQPKAVKPVVQQYVVRNGRLVRRSKWAIQWDLTHPHP